MRNILLAMIGIFLWVIFSSTASAQEQCEMTVLAGGDNTTVPFGPFPEVTMTVNFTSGFTYELKPPFQGFLAFTDSYGTTHDRLSTIGRWTTLSAPSASDPAIKFTFSPAIPARWIAFSISDVDITPAPSPSRWQFTVNGDPAQTQINFARSNVRQLLAMTGPNANGVVRAKGSSGTTKGYGMTLYGVTDTLVSSLRVEALDIPAIDGDYIAYTIAAVPSCVTTRKQTVDGFGSFSFSYTNLVSTGTTLASNDTLTTTASNNPAASSQKFVLARSGNATISEITQAPAFRLTGASCMDNNAALSGNGTGTFGTLSGTTLTIPSGNLRPEADIVCTFTNTQQNVDLQVTKTNTPTLGRNDQDADTVAFGATTTYSLVVTNNGPASVTGAVVTDTPVTHLNCPASNDVTITGDGVPSGSFTVSDLTGSGIALATLNANESTTLTFQCTVN